MSDFYSQESVLEIFGFGFEIRNSDPLGWNHSPKILELRGQLCFTINVSI